MTKVSRLTVCVMSMSLLLAVLAGGSQSASATLVTQNHVDKGWYQSTGLHYASIQNYFVGNKITGDLFNNWVVFDLTGVSDTIVDATLSIYNPGNNDPIYQGFMSSDPSETYGLFDVDTAIDDLVAGGTGLTDIYNDLGTGVMLGSADVTDADNRAYVNIVLNAAGIAYLNAHLGQFVAFGGRITTLDADVNTVERVFNGSTSYIDSHRLIFNTDVVVTPPAPTTGAVPEPATAAMGLMALVGLATACRRRN